MKLFLLLVLFFFPVALFAQETLNLPSIPGQLSGDFQMNLNMFQRDSAIGASGTPLYNNLLSGGEAWLNLKYSVAGFDMGVRFDLYNNSNLINPTEAYTAQGIGFWYITKTIKKLTVTAGYFYDQFGSGIVYRAYEDRGLGIDYATVGIHLEYKFNPNWHIKAFTGREKNLFDTWQPIIKGINGEGFVKVSDKLSFSPGVAFLNRTMDATSMGYVINDIELYPASQQFQPVYNVYAYSLYNTLCFKNFNWYAEAAQKSREASYNDAGVLVNEPGSVYYTSLNYSQKGLGITLQGKRTDNFNLRTSPNETLLNGVLDFIPPLTQQNTLRLLSRYVATTQTVGEIAGEGDLVYTPANGYRISLNYSNVHDLNDVQLYQEYYGDIEITKWEQTKWDFGVQNLFYNIAVYHSEPGSPSVQAWTPFTEITYKITHKKSLRCELQYQAKKQDDGSWAYALIEYNIAPKLSFDVSDMYNIVPNPPVTTQKLHYYNFFIAYTEGATRYTISYVKQVAGYDCSGGVCRYEPAFAGMRIGITTSF